MKRVHIVGCPRSGTTLLLQLLATCFENDGHCEFESNIYQEPDGNPSLYFSKRPTDIKIIRPVLEADRELFVIYLVRDPRAVVCSVHDSVPDKYFCHFLLWRECDRPARKLIGHERFAVVRYEDLVRDPDGVQRRLCHEFPFLRKKCDFSRYHLHLDWSPSSRATQAMNGLRPISEHRIQSWQRHLPRIKAELLTFPQMQEALVYYGYEKDDSWTSVLDSVAPHFVPSRHRTDKGLWFRLGWRFRNWRKLRKKLRRIGKRRVLAK